MRLNLCFVQNQYGSKLAFVCLVLGRLFHKNLNPRQAKPCLVLATAMGKADNHSIMISVTNASRLSPVDWIQLGNGAKQTFQ